uniref:Uncharacterized protein n=1 Tax=Solanum lycopersicum TaxID=4081 RepID=A0A3Q7HAI3_SOLLC
MSTSEQVGGGRGGGRRRLRGGGNNGVWPEPFLEALATQMAINTTSSINRLAAAQALSNLFQVHTPLKLLYTLS